MASVGGTVETRFTADIADFSAKIGKVKAAFADVARSIKSSAAATESASSAIKSLATDSARAVRVAAGQARVLQKAMADVAAISQQGKSGSIIDNASLRQSVALIKQMSAEMAAMRAASGMPFFTAPQTRIPRAPAAPAPTPAPMPIPTAGPSKNALGLALGRAEGIADPKVAASLAATAQQADRTQAAYARLSSATASLGSYLGQNVMQAQGFAQALRGLQFVGTALGGTFLALQAAKKLVDWGGDAAKIEDAKRVMQSMGFTIAEMREKTKGLLSDQQLAKGFGLASSMGITANQFQRFAVIADAAAKKMGITQEYAFESLVKGASRSSARWLDNAGIAVQWSKAHEDAAKTLGKTVRELSNAEKKQAELNMVMQQGEKIVQEVRGVNATTSDSYDQFLASVSNLADNLKTSLIPAMQTAAQVAQWLNQSLESAMSKDMRSSTEVLGSALGLQAKAVDFAKRALSEGRVSGDLSKAIADSAILVQIERDLASERGKGKNANQLLVDNLVKARAIMLDINALSNAGSASFGRFADRIAVQSAELLDARKTLALTGQGFIEDLANRSRGRIESEEQAAAAQRRSKEIADERLRVEEKIIDALKRQRAESAIASAAFGGAVERPFQELQKTLAEIQKMSAEATKAGGSKLSSNLANLNEQTALVLQEFGADLGKAVKEQKTYVDQQKLLAEASRRIYDIMMQTTNQSEMAALNDAIKALQGAAKEGEAALDEEARKRGNEIRQKFQEKIQQEQKKEVEIAKKVAETTANLDEKLRTLKASVPAVEQSLIDLSRTMGAAEALAAEGAKQSDIQDLQRKAISLFIEEIANAKTQVGSLAEAKLFDSAALNAIDSQINALGTSLPDATAALIDFADALESQRIDAGDLGRQMALSLRGDSLANALALNIGNMFSGFNASQGITDASTVGLQRGFAEAGGAILGGAATGNLSASTVGGAIGAAAGGPIGAEVGAALAEGIAKMAESVASSIAAVLPQASQSAFGAVASGLYGMLTGPLFLGPLASISSAIDIAQLSRSSEAGKRAESAMEAASRRIAEAAAPAADMLLALADVSSRALSPIIGMMANNRAIQEMLFGAVKAISMAMVMVADWFEGPMFDTTSELDRLYAELAAMNFDDAVAAGNALADEQERLTSTTASLNSELRNLPQFFNIGRTRANSSLAGVSGNPLGRVVEGTTVIIQEASFNGVQNMQQLAAQLQQHTRQALLRQNKIAGIASITNGR